MSRRLLFALVLAPALGLQVGCSEDCDMDHFDWNVAVTVEELPGAAVTVCIDGDCSELDQVDGVDGDTRFEGWIDLPNEEAAVEVTVTDASGTTRASLSERRTPTGDACYRNIALEADADGIRWIG